MVLPYLAERFGGPVVSTANTGARLRDLGCRVSYWAACLSQDWEEASRVEDARLFAPVWPKGWRRTRDLEPALLEALPGIDIVQINGVWPHTSLAAARAAKRGGKPYIISVRGSLEPWRVRSNPLKRLKKMIYMRLVVDALMRDAACLHAVTEREAEHFRMAGHRGPIAVVTNGVDADWHTPGDRSAMDAFWPELRGRMAILFYSRLSREKGLDLLLPAWRGIVAKRKDAVLVLAGPDSGGYERKVDALIREGGLASSVLKTGMLKGERKLAALRGADLMILPSYSENFGLVVAEAMACARPVIATTGTPWKVVEDAGAGLWVAPEIGAIRGALEKLMVLRPEERDAMGRRGRELVLREMTWPSIARKFMSLYAAIRAGEPIPERPA
jgi:glycosyltransferase involved in cell wall biosynthesis